MPELPEVETVRRGLAPVMEGKVIETCIQRRPDLRWPLPDRFAERLTGRRVERLGRRSKYILAELEGGETLIIHLGMSGRMLIEGSVLGDYVHEAGGHGKHDHIEFQMEGGARIIFNDARRFGAMDLCETEGLEDHKLIASLGPEPLGNAFNADLLAERLKGKQTPIKAALLDQKIVAGLGNIYVCEALFRSGISPKRLAGSISRARIETLTHEIRETLMDAIKAGGSSLRDYRQADGELGYFQHTFRVYDREGEPCRTDACDQIVRRIVQSGRSSFYCAKCQR
ncbi:MAG: bifunctional DNA-formamidopyrimidine glycosylase/DNA-(apurinic or apyrimidinic site) lyase [Pseudomonadota bacterium]